MCMIGCSPSGIFFSTNIELTCDICHPQRCLSFMSIIVHGQVSSGTHLLDKQPSQPNNTVVNSMSKIAVKDPSVESEDNSSPISKTLNPFHKNNLQ